MSITKTIAAALLASGITFGAVGAASANGFGVDFGFDGWDIGFDEEGFEVGVNDGQFGFGADYDEFDDEDDDDDDDDWE
jgi:hypothetical protein